jgi:hypothetical protein
MKQTYLLTCLYFVSTLLASQGWLSGESRIALGPSSGLATSTGELEIHFDTDDRVAGVQIDLTFDPAYVSVSGSPLLGGAAPNHSVDGSGVEPGRYRIIIVSLDSDFIVSGKLVSVPITFNKTIPEASRAISIGEVVVSDRYGLESSFSFSPFVSISGLVGGMEIPAGQPLPIEAVAFGFEGGVERVNVLVNGQLIGVSPSSPFSASWTPIEPGQVLVTALAKGNDGEEVPAPEVVLNVAGEPLTSFASWREFFFTAEQLANPMVSGATGDADFDGTLNVFEFLSGTNPNNTEALGDSFEHSTVIDGGLEYLTLTVRRRVTMSDTVLRAVSSAEPGFADTADAVPVSLERVGDYEIITFRDTIPQSDSDTSRRFMRVELDYTPPSEP